MLLLSPSQPPAAPWQVRCYLRESGKNDTATWYQGLSKRARVKLRTRLHYLRFQPPSRWIRPDAVALKDHVCVIHLKDETGSEHRITGYFDHQHHAFVICVLGFEKDRQYHPPDYEDRTKKCRESVGRAFEQRTAEWPFGFF